MINHVFLNAHEFAMALLCRYKNIRADEIIKALESPAGDTEVYAPAETAIVSEARKARPTPLPHPWILAMTDLANGDVAARFWSTLQGTSAIVGSFGNVWKLAHIYEDDDARQHVFPQQQVAVSDNLLAFTGEAGPESTHVLAITYYNEDSILADDDDEKPLKSITWVW
jgi:hypothetical protein